MANLIANSNSGDSTCLQVDIFMKKILLNRLFTSGAYRGGTDCTQSVKYSQITQYKQE